MLTQEKLKELFDYDDSGNLIWKVAPSGRRNPDGFAGRTDNKGYRVVQIDRKPYGVHRLIFLYHHGYLPKYVDHKDRDPGNNKVENLRAASQSQNQSNRFTQINNKTGFKGVYVHKQNGRFMSEIRLNGRKIYLGVFSTAEEAARAYDAAACRLHGEFAVLNFP